MAKLASDLAKPDGLLVVEPGTELEFLHPLPVGRLWGVGPATERKLAALGVQTVGELAAIPEDTLVRTLGNAPGHHLHALAWNRDDRPVVAEHEVKSIGHEETFPVDLHDHAALEHRMVGLADGVASRLRAAHVTARTVQLKVRFADFTHHHPVAHARRAHRPRGRHRGRVARELLGRLDVGPGSACSASRCSSSCAPSGRRGSATAPGGPDEEGQGQLVRRPGRRPPRGPDRQAALERSVDAVRARFGPGAVGPGSRIAFPGKARAVRRVETP